MDNFNALSKSAILTKLALDGYFIDLLTLNSFIKDWQIEAIYENEFGIEFFDNNSYLTILDKLKEKYNKTKKGMETSSLETKEPAAVLPKEEMVDVVKNEAPKEEAAAISLDKLAEEAKKEPVAEEKTIIEIPSETPVKKTIDEALEKIAPETSIADFVQNETISLVQEPLQIEDEQLEDAIMPIAMKNLKPGPVSPNSNIVVDHSYEPVHSGNQNKSSLDDLIVEENFSEDEIEKANDLINKTTQKPLPESITETYFDTKTYVAQTVDKKDAEAKKDPEPEKASDAKEAKSDEMDLMQLAQSFAQNFTGGDMKDVPPADLEQIFADADSYTDTFSELQDYVKEEPEEYKSLQEDLPSDIVAPEVPKEATHSDSALVSHNTSSLNADDIRSIIREEITRQTANIIPVPQNNENVKEILREIVKQTADVVPQNAFKLDISQGTLDMIAKTIAKKIAIKLNNYYKLNSSKQNAKLQMFRTRTIELKERNQMLADENRKLKARLLEANSDLEMYKPSIFGLFKYTGRKRR